MCGSGSRRPRCRAATAFSDIELAAKHLLPKGVIVVDDYQHAFLPGVTRAVDRFLVERREFRVLADLNRHAGHGRKIYLMLSG
jgi:hypothetical protein